MQQQRPPMSQHQPMMPQQQWPGQQGPPQGQPGQQPPPGAQPQPPQQFNQGVRVPHSSPNAPMMSPNNGNVRMPMTPPAGANPQMRPAWSGETHPALAQVPRTPQQLQHLQRLQMQREQQQQMMGGQQMGQQQVMGQQPPMSAAGPMQPPQQQFMPPQQQQQPQPQTPPVMPNGANQNKTKAALANMLNNRMAQPAGPPGTPGAGGPPPPGAMPMQQQPIPPQMPMPPDGSAASRLQHINQQLHHPHMMQPGGQPGPPQQMYPQQRQMFMQHQQRMGYQMGPGGRMMMPGGQRPPGPPQMQPPPQGPRIMFHGHDPTTKREILNSFPFVVLTIILWFLLVVTNFFVSCSSPRPVPARLHLLLRGLRGGPRVLPPRPRVEEDRASVRGRGGACLQFAEVDARSVPDAGQFLHFSVEERFVNDTRRLLI